MTFEKIDMTGQTFGRMTVLKEDGRSTDGEVMWLCRCACGTLKHVRGRNLRQGHIKSCGCLKKTYNYRHGETPGHFRSKLYNVWSSMMQHAKEHGVPVCTEWRDSAVFIEWARQRGWRPGLFFSRVNTCAGWYPENAVFSVRRNPGRTRNARVLPLPKPDKHGRRKPQ